MKRAKTAFASLLLIFVIGFFSITPVTVLGQGGSQSTKSPPPPPPPSTTVDPNVLLAIIAILSTLHFY